MTDDARKARLVERVTLKSVAKAARVSPITVSNVVNGRFHSMSMETRRRVEEAIDALNYRANIAARGLRRSVHYCVLLVVVDRRRAFLAQPAHHQIAAGLSNVLNSSGYALAIEGIAPDQISDSSLLGRLSSDAICLLASGNDEDRAKLLAQFRVTGQPIVVFHESPVESQGRICYVRSDDKEGGRILAEHLHGRNIRRLLLLLPKVEWTTMRERANGVREFWLDQPGVELDVVRADGISVAEVDEALSEHFRTHGAPEAIVGGNDLLAAAAAKFCRAQGDDVSTVKIGGFGGYEFLQFLERKITSVQIPSYEMGEVAGRQILSALKEGDFPERDIRLPVRLIGGETT